MNAISSQHSNAVSFAIADENGPVLVGKYTVRPIQGAIQRVAVRSIAPVPARVEIVQSEAAVLGMITEMKAITPRSGNMIKTERLIRVSNLSLDE